MDITRRGLLAGAGGLAAAPALRALRLHAPEAVMPHGAAGTLPVRDDFAIPAGQTYLNSAFIHPIPVAAAEAVRRYLDTRTFREPRLRTGDSLAAEVKGEFAQLINAQPEEIALVPSTSVGENLVVNGLGMAGGAGNVVTDALHFDGSLVLYGELAKRGLDLRIVRPREWRIELDDLARAMDARTKLVAISLVSWYNGFQHDLKAVCDLAHAHGARVYADVIQAAGNTPIDVKASGVDFCACSTFKWLMGDFGLGFLYVRQELLDTVIRRTEIGYAQADTDMHYLPTDPPAPTPVTWTLHADAAGHFQVGTYAQAAANALAVSLPYLQRLGIENILAHRQPLLRRLREEMPRLGFTALTPPETTSAIAVYMMPGAERRFADRLKAANVSVSVYTDRIRIAPSIFNDMRDIETLLGALS
ncbi:MAG TPA: aminotransferase class V-fold PLP-dependent enzyme [Gemmatimonadales bacterium]|nr:aminotransferase class V-fold PLP-dependent enzyme [Gemmatimonadales bacterium]